MATTYTASGSERVGYGGGEGVMVGNSSSDLVGFYGTAPVARPSVTWPNTGTATTTLNEAKVNRIMAALVAVGLIVTT